MLDEISEQYARDSSLEGMLEQKKVEMALLLRANVYSDSLWEQALYLESHPSEFLFYAPGTATRGRAAEARAKSSSEDGTEGHYCGDDEQFAAPRLAAPATAACFVLELG